jgi:hypothetical protein
LDPATGTDEDDDKKEGELLRRFQQRCETVGKGPICICWCRKGEVVDAFNAL